jgi:hypothetical protein
MPLLTATGEPPHTKIIVQTRLQTEIDNIQPWHYSGFEWGQLNPQLEKWEKLGATHVSDPCPVYNCHGFTFASRRTQVDETNVTTIAKILEEDGYKEVQEAQAALGDVVVYYDEEGAAQHSGLVISRIVGQGLDVPKIWSKWGKGHEWVHPLRVCLWGGMSTRFYRILKWKFEEVFGQNL